MGRKIYTRFRFLHQPHILLLLLMLPAFGKVTVSSYVDILWALLKFGHRPPEFALLLTILTSTATVTPSPSSQILRATVAFY
jgi:hypothetical protein